jgi:hypothetical protein
VRQRPCPQAELHRRVEEALDGIERNHQALRDAAERQPDFKAVLGHHQVPELVLENDRHFFRILREQPRRQFDALRGGKKRNEEMMLPGQAVLGGVDQYAAQHSAQRVTRQHIVSDMIGRHYRSCRVQRLPLDRRRCRSPDSPTSRMLPRRRPEVSSRCRRWRKFRRGPVLKQIEVEASVARCLRTPPSGA